MIEPGTVVSMADIARRADVRRPAVTNWRRRHTDFPTAVSRSPREVFDAEEVAGWLDLRRISAKSRHSDEPPGTTFGDRFRRSFGDGGALSSASDQGRRPRRDRPVEQHPAERVHELISHLVEPLNQIRNIEDPANFVDLLLTLLYLRATDLENWTRLTEDVRADCARTLVDYLSAPARESLFPRQKELPPSAETPVGGMPELRQTIRHLDDWSELAPAATGKPAEMASVLCEELLDQVAISLGRRGGEFHTPRRVAGLVADIVAPHGGERLHDPCCGDGNLLVAAASRATKSGGPASVSGQALSARPRLLAQLNLALHGIEAALGSAAAKALREANPAAHEFDVVVANPPFNTRHWADDPADSPWRYGAPPRSNGNFAWLQHVAALLAPGGRAAVLMAPNSTFSASPAERAIRAKMIEDGVVAAVIELPPALFHNTSIPVVIWVLQKGRPHNTGVLVLDASEAKASDFSEISRIYARWRRDGALGEPRFRVREFDIGELKTANYSLNPRGLLASAADTVDRDGEAGRLDDLSRELDELAQRTHRLDEVITHHLDRLTARDIPAALPGGWTRARLDELCAVHIGPPRVDTTDDETGIPIVTARQIRDRRIHDEQVERATAATAQKSPRYRLKQGDIVCVRTGTVDRAALVDEEHVGWLVGRGCLLLRPGRNVHPAYLLHYLSHPSVVEWVRRSATSSVLPTISVRNIRELPVLLPPRAHQERVAALLDSVDEKIAMHTRIVRTARELHASAVSALLGDVRPSEDTNAPPAGRGARDGSG